MFMTQFSGPLSHSHKTEVVIHTYKKFGGRKKNSFLQGSKLVHAGQATHISANHNVGILGRY